MRSEDQRGALLRLARLEPEAPRRLAVLIDCEFGSNCDEFALTIGAGFRGN